MLVKYLVFYLKLVEILEKVFSHCGFLLQTSYQSQKEGPELFELLLALFLVEPFE